MPYDDAIALRSLLADADPELLTTIGGAVDPYAESVSDEFYSSIQEHDDAHAFLDNEVVETRLRDSLARWVRDLFVVRRGSQIDEYIERQSVVGDRHARINVPLGLITVGIGVLKKAMFRHIVDSDIDRGDLANAIILVDELVDLSTGLMNRVYMSDLLSDARDQQSLKLQYAGVDMAIQTEGLRASLFDWHRQILRLLIEDSINPRQVPSIRKTNFGLWVTHKAELIFQGAKEIDQLKEILVDVEKTLIGAFDPRQKIASTRGRLVLDRLDDLVTSASAVLSNITEQTLAMEAGRDPLTKLFNRRFMRTVLQREIKMSQSTGDSFALIMADIDHFKQINDRYGHDIGDITLRQVAELLVVSLRAGDFVFRYGGEEFLLVISAVTADQAVVVANKILNTMRDYRFRISDAESIPITLSLGVALFSGHPDYSNLLTEADQALLEAKRQGRDRLVFFSSISE